MNGSTQPTATYLNFDLLITRAGEGYRAYVIDAPGGDAAVSFALPPDMLTGERLVHGGGARRGARLRNPSPPTPPPDLRTRGRTLFETIFRDEVRSVLVASQSEAQAAGRDLRIRLRFSDDAVDLATLPWEILFDTEQQHFLALSEARPILRYLSLPRPRPALVVQPPLSILAVLASPTDHQTLNVEEEWQAIETALADLRANDKIRLERLATPTFDALRERLLGDPVHVLHFIGHGLYDKEESEGQLLFENSQRQGHVVPAKAVALLLHNHPSLRLAYLNACEGAIADQGNVFAGVAQTLVQQGVPAAVAMQDEISDAAAIEMARTFYTALATGRPVDTALSHARVALATRDNDEWAIPVLFSRSPDNRLFDLVEVLPTPTCPYPGMRPFTTEQADKFFGRDQEIDDAVHRLAQHPFLAVVGPSGSGKSSLIYAGIIPALQRSGRFGDGTWTIKTMRPSDSRTADGKAAPLAALATLLDVTGTSEVSVTLENKTLLFIDQFEELFTLAAANEAERFIKTLHELIGTPKLTILLTVRADFYPDLMTTGALWEAIKVNRLELTPLGDDELWHAIVQPAAKVGVTVEDALAVALIADAAGESGALPLVQETLVLLWEKVERQLLKLDAYRQMADSGRSGLQVAIDRWADNVYNNKLPPAAQPITRRIFLRLIQFGQGRADTRRQQTVESCAQAATIRRPLTRR
ncbi:MAG TPA: CHAT domain-containing protein [Caldilineaceae bacterium]|mgnify:CR=1 FL=1|nr:CHAT domain-containing protein [Caldilineaceae bacterium]